MSLRNRARRLQRETGLTYQQALARLRALEANARRRGPVIEVVDATVPADPIAALCERLREACDARAVVLLGDDGRPLARVGHVVDPAMMLMVPWRRPRARTDPGAIVLGPTRRAFWTPVGDALLVVVFDDRTSLGLVRLRVHQILDELRRLLQAAQWPLPTAAREPGGAGGTGGLTAAAYESVEIFALKKPS